MINEHHPYENLTTADLLLGTGVHMQDKPVPKYSGRKETKKCKCIKCLVVKEDKDFPTKCGKICTECKSKHKAVPQIGRNNPDWTHRCSRCGQLKTNKEFATVTGFICKECK